jgi:hypothetical protein
MAMATPKPQDHLVPSPTVLMAVIPVGLAEFSPVRLAGDGPEEE